MKRLVAALLALTLATTRARAETRAQAARRKHAAAIAQLFEGQPYPPKVVLLRHFKREGQLELWAGSDRLRLIKTYAVCAKSGTLGPKRQAGDGQVPEGFYNVSGLNPNSSYHLSLRVDYPNAADRIRNRASHDLGGDIFIHGKCVTIGCIPIEDEPIEELFTIAADVEPHGKLAVHIFPARMDDANWADLKADPNHAFWDNLREGYALFERTQRLPRIRIDAGGRYVFSP